jgi:hypothetical protein
MSADTTGAKPGAGSPDERLAKFLRFTPADLELNRRGRMSRAQRLRLLQADLGWLMFAVVLFGVTAVSVGLLAGINGKAILIALLAAAWGIWSVVRAFKGGVDAMKGRVFSERTRLDPYTEDSGTGSTVYRLRTDAGYNLRVWENTYDAIATGTLYRVHFAPLTRKLISLEDASGAPPLEQRDAAPFIGGERPQREFAWAVLLGAVAILDVLIGLSVAAEFHTTATLDVAAPLASFGPLIVWIVYANRLPTGRSALWTVRGIALFVTLAIPWTIWIALHGLPCPPNCGPGT